MGYTSEIFMHNSQTKSLKSRAVKFVTIRDGKVLMVKEFGKDVYGLPGGRVEENETVEDGLIRELTEELCCVPIDFQLFSEITIPGRNQGETYHFMFFLGKLKGKVKPSSEIESFVWIDKADIDNIVVKLHPHIAETKIMEDLIAKGLIN